MFEKKLERNWIEVQARSRKNWVKKQAGIKLQEWGPNPDGDVGKQFRKKERYILGDENDSLKELRGLMLSRLIDFALSNNDSLRN